MSYLYIILPAYDYASISKLAQNIYCWEELRWELGWSSTFSAKSSFLLYILTATCTFYPKSTRVWQQQWMSPDSSCGRCQILGACLKLLPSLSCTALLTTLWWSGVESAKATVCWSILVVAVLDRQPFPSPSELVATSSPQWGLLRSGRLSSAFSLPWKMITSATLVTWASRVTSSELPKAEVWMAQRVFGEKSQFQKRNETKKSKCINC